MLQFSGSEAVFGKSGCQMRQPRFVDLAPGEKIGRSWPRTADFGRCNLNNSVANDNGLASRALQWRMRWRCSIVYSEAVEAFSF